MPSLRAILAFAAAALATLSSAAPVVDGTSQVAQLVGVSNVANGVAHDVNVNGVGVAVVDLGKRVPMLDAVIFDVLENAKREEQPQSLPVILLDVKAQLETVSGKLTTLVNGKTNIDVEILKPIIADVYDILAATIVSVKLIIGKPVDFILTLDGKVLAAVDVCHILISVLVLVHGILSCILHVVAAASIKIVSTLIVAIASLLVDLLVLIFVDLKAGIFVAIGPLLTPALYNALAAINLDVVVAVLKKGTN